MNKRQSSALRFDFFVIVMHRQINGVPLEMPMQSIIASCNAIHLTNKTAKARHKRARNRFLLLKNTQCQYGRFSLSLFLFQINMNYEKWPFNLGFSQYDDHRCILFHFQLWFGIVADWFSILSIAFSSHVHCEPCTICKLEFCLYLSLSMLRSAIEAMSMLYECATKIHNISNVHVSMPIEWFQLWRFEFFLSEYALATHNRTSWAIECSLIWNNKEKEQRFDHHSAI